MNFSNTFKKIINIIDKPPIEPYFIEKTNQKTGEVEKVSIIPTVHGPYVSEYESNYR